MTFLEPGFLVLGLLSAFAWVGPLATQDRRHAALRTAALLFCVIALARPVRTGEDTAEHRVIVLDRSSSVSDSADAAMRDSVSTMINGASTEGVEWTVIELDGQGRAALELPAGVSREVVLGKASSQMGAALEAALRAIPDGARQAGVTLITDGLGTDDPSGSADAFARQELTARGIPVDVVALAGVDGDLRPVGLEPIGKALRVGREVTVVARLLGGGQVVNCVLSGPQGELARTDGVQVSGDHMVPMTFVPSKAGAVDVSLSLEVTDGVDPRTGDLVLERTLVIDPPLRVSYVGTRVTDAPERLSELLGPGFKVEDATGDVRARFAADGTPYEADDASDLIGPGIQGADVVFLDDIPAKDLPVPVQDFLAESVRSGATGLIAAGGEASFGPGGYHNEPIEELLPVEFVQKEEKRDPSTTLVVIIDTSGSMGGNRVQLAKEVSRLAIRRLLPHDKVGMVEFYGAKRWAVPIQPASNSIEIERALNRLDAGGGTVILPAIEEAYYGLKNVRTRFKHVLILTDGGVETGAFEPILRRMADDGMNVSTVLIGPDAHSEFLVNIANWGQGRFYSVPNRFNLPEILLKQPASAKLPAYRPGIVNVKARGGQTWWGDINLDEVPALSGYVETRSKPGATNLIETAEEGHPILSTWRYGAGRVTALTTEPTGPGTEGWSDWDGYGELLGRVIEQTAADDNRLYRFRLQREPGGARLIVEQTGSDLNLFLDEAPCVATYSVAGEERAIVLGPVAIDRWEGHVPLAVDQSLRVQITPSELSLSGNGPRTLALPGRTWLVLDALAGGARELQVAPEAAELLAERLGLAGASTPLAEFQSVRTAELPGAVRSRLAELAPLFALLALLTYLLDVAYRRWPRTAVRN